MIERRIFSVSFDDDGSATVSFIEKTDVRAGGQLALQKALFLSSNHPDYRDDINELKRKAERALENALEDFEAAEPWDPDDEEQEEAQGMGDH